MKNKGKWKLIVGIMCLLGAMSAIADGTEGAFESLVVGALLIAWWYLPRKAAKQNTVNVEASSTAPMTAPQYIILIPCALQNGVNAIPQGFVAADNTNIEQPNLI